MSHLVGVWRFTNSRSLTLLVCLAACGGSDGRANPFDDESSGDGGTIFDQVPADDDDDGPLGQAETTSAPAVEAQASMIDGASTIDFEASRCSDGSASIPYESDTDAYIAMSGNGSVVYEAAFTCAGDPDRKVLIESIDGTWDPVDGSFAMNGPSEVFDQALEPVFANDDVSVIGRLDRANGTIEAFGIRWPITAAFEEGFTTIDEALEAGAAGNPLDGDGTDGEAGVVVIDSFAAATGFIVDFDVAGSCPVGWTATPTNGQEVGQLRLERDGRAIYSIGAICTGAADADELSRAKFGTGTWDPIDDTFVVEVVDTTGDTPPFVAAGRVDRSTGFVTIDGAQHLVSMILS